VIDLGTGDGRYVLAAAAADPTRLVIGVDASADAMAESSRRAARPPARGGLPNAMFVVAAAEAPPPELRSIADRVVIQLPWGSLLRGALAMDDAAAAGIARLVAPAGRVEILLAPAVRDRLDPDVDVRRRLANGLADDWRRAGLELCDARPATDEEIAAARSTWARRLGLRADDPERAAFRLVLRTLPPTP
jgi:16S rRNA (adenine(1408)-N(1))-methyltransferase